jgi:hypothetical protein
MVYTPRVYEHGAGWRMTLPDDDGAWLRAWTIPEEDRRKYTSEPWRGEARWFRSSNIVCLEIWRRTDNRQARRSVEARKGVK